MGDAERDTPTPIEGNGVQVSIAFAVPMKATDEPSGFNFGKVTWPAGLASG